MSLAVIVPTRGRPHTVTELARAWVETGTTATLVLGVDRDDPTLPQYHEAFDAIPDDVSAMLTIGPRQRMIGTLNTLAVFHAREYDHVGFLGDDHRPRGHQPLERLAAHLEGPGIAYGDDLYQHDAMATAVVMSSSIVTALGYMAPPTLLHLKADQVWVAWGQHMRALHYDPTCIVEHLHPWAGKGTWDGGYEEANDDATSSADADAYWAYMQQGRFDDDVDKLLELA